MCVLERTCIILDFELQLQEKDQLSCGTEDRQIYHHQVMAWPRQPGLVVLLLLLGGPLGCWGPLGCRSLLPTCPDACVCPDRTLINCSSSGLRLAPRHPSMDGTTDLDLSHNLLSSLAPRRHNPQLRALRLGNNQISYLSLCLEKGSPDGGRLRRRPPGVRRNRSCVSWAPGLLLLSMERNGLVEPPHGLGGSRSLQVLQLSFNQISTLEAGHLKGLGQLKELHLHHNLLSSLHPQAFMGLTSLTVIDLRFNLLTSISPATFLSPRGGLEVRGGANPWRCDCDMASLRRWTALDVDGDQRLWLDIVCSSPSSLAGRDLLRLQEEDLGCLNPPGFHQDLTVAHGASVLLPCFTQQGSTWWTPKGQMSANESHAGLLISDITERDVGLYICMSQSHQDFVSVYNLKIREIGGGQPRANGRLPRSLPGDSLALRSAKLSSGQVRAQTAENNLGLAVGLSVFFTFLVAFILGVLARPYIDVLWRMACRKKNASPQPGSVSSTGQGPHDNQAYSDQEDDPESVPHRERRVTFSTADSQEQSSMDYYDTLAWKQREEAHGKDSLEDRRRAADPEQTLSQFEHIPDGNEQSEKRSLSSDEEQDNRTRTQKKSWKASSSQPVDDCIQQKTTHLNETRLTDQDQLNDNGEAFDFPESIQSGSARSSIFGSFNHSKNNVFPPSKQPIGISSQEIWKGELQNAQMAPDHSDSSQSSSCESDDEVTEYTFNHGAADEDGETGRISKSISYHNVSNSTLSVPSNNNVQHTSAVASDLSISQGPITEKKMVRREWDLERSPFEQSDINKQNNTWPKLDLSRVTRVKRRLDIKVATESTGPAVTQKDTDQGSRWSQLDIGNANQVKQPVDIKASNDSTSSSSDGDEDPTDVRVKIEKTSPPIVHLGRNREYEMNVQNESWPVVDLSRVTGVKRRLDIKVVTVTTVPAVTLKDTDHDYRYHVKPHPDIKASIKSTSSSSDSEEENMGPLVNLNDTYVKTKVEKAYQPHLHLGTVKPIKDFEINAQEDRWPELELSKVTGIKRRLDIKVATPSPDVTSSIGESGEDDRWPKLDLANITGIKRHLDIKVATESTVPAVTLKDTDQGYRYHVKPHPDIKASTDFTSSSSDREEETSDVSIEIEKTSPPIVHLGTNKKYEMNVQNESWPVVDLSRLIGVKKRLDIKVVTETTVPAVTLKDTDHDYRYHVKPRPDIKASIKSTSSSSDGEEENMGPVVNLDDTYVKTKVGNAYQPHLHLGTVKPIKDLEINAQEDRWPKLDLTNITGINRRLDIKVATESTGPAVTLKDTDQGSRWSQLDIGNANQVKQPVDIKASTDSTSSSSDGDEDPTDVRVKIEKTSPPIVHLGRNREYEMNVQNESWPVVDLSRVTGIKRRLDIKVATPSPDVTSSIGESGEDDRWPKLDLANITGIKRHLDIKVATESTVPAVTLKDTDQGYRYHVKPHPDIKASTDFTSSSSDSEEETSDVSIEIEKTSPPIVHLGTNKKYEMNVQNESWPVVDLSRLIGVKRRLDIKVVTETTVPAVTLKDTDHDYRYHVKPRPDIKASIKSTSSSSDREEENMGPLVNLDDTYVKTKVENSYQPHLHLGTVKPIKDFEINAQEDRWPELELSKVTGIKRRLDIKVATPSPDVISSIGESGEDDRWPKLDLTNITGIKPRPYIKVATESTVPAVTQKDTDQGYRYHVKPRPDIKASIKSTSSSSDSEEENMGPAVNLDDTYVKTKVGNAYQPHLHLGTVKPIKNLEINAQEDRWPELDLTNITGINRRLDIKVATESTGPAVTQKDTDQGSRWSQLDIGNANQVKQPVDIKASTDSTSSSSDGDEDPTDVRVKIEKTSPPIVHLGRNREYEMNVQNECWPVVDLSRVTGVKRRLDIKVVTVTTVPAVTLKDTDHDYRYHVKPRPDIKASIKSTSSSSDSEEENMGPLVNLDDTYVKTKVENAYQPHLHLGTVKPIKDFEINAQEDRWPELELSKVTGIKRRLDIKVATPSPDVTSSIGESGEDDRWPKLDLANITGIKRHLDIKVATESTVPAVTLKDTDQGYRYHVKPHPDIKASTDFTSSSSDSEEETSDVSIEIEKTSPPIVHLGTNKKYEMNVQNESWPVVDLSRLIGVKKRLDIKVVTETTVPAVTLKDTDHDYRYHVKPRPDIKASIKSTSSSSDREEENMGPLVNLDDTYVKTKVENSYQPHLHLGTVKPIKDFEINAQEDRWPKLDLTNITGINRRLDIKVATESTGPAVTLKDTDQGSRWSQLDIGNANQVKQPVDIKASTDSTSSSSDGDEDPTDVRVKIEKTSPPIVHLGRNREYEMNVQNESWPVVDLSRVTGVKRRLDIKVVTVTTVPAVTLKDTDHDYRYHVKPRPDIKASIKSTSSNSEEENMGPLVNLDDTYVKTKVENAYQPHLHLGTVKPIKDFEINAQEDRWPELELSKVTGIKRRLDIKVATPSPDVTSSIGESGKLDLTNIIGIKPQPYIKVATESTGPAVTLKDTDQGSRWSQLNIGNANQVKQPVDIKASTDYTSSSSDGDEDPTDVRVKIEKTSPPIVHLGRNREYEMNVQNESWPVVDLSRVTGVKRRLDIKVVTVTTVPAVTLKDTDHDYRYHVKPRPDIKASTDFTSSSSDSEEENMGPVVNLDDTYVKTKLENAYRPPLHLGTVKPIKNLEINANNDRWPELDLSRIPRIKRRLDIKASTEIPGSAVTLEDRWPRCLDIKAPTPSPEMTSSGSRVSPQSSSHSESEVKVQTVKQEREGPAVGTIGQIRWPDLNPFVPRINRRLDVKAPSPIPPPGDREDEKIVHPGPDNTSTSHLASRLAGLNLGTSHLDISKAAPIKVLSETDILSSSGDRVEGKEWDLKRGTVMESEINAQNKTWPLVDLGNVTGVKRRLDLKIATPPPDITSSSSETVEDNHWTKLALSFHRIKQRLDIKAATRSSKSSDLSIEDRWKTQIQDVQPLLDAPPPVPDCPPPDSASGESEDDVTQVTDFTEYRTHGPGHSFALSDSGTSDTKVASSLKTGDEQTWSSVTDTRERKGLGALRAMSSERKRWDTDHKGPSGPLKRTGSRVDVPSLNYSGSGKDLELHTSVIQEATAPGRLPRSLQRTGYQSRLMGRYVQGEDTKDILQNTPQFDLSNPVTEV
ncbi:hypothetical protein NHX12_033544 [Muraenolepis orangiensis]|uniref:Ig-like domain-containing protein n=1 Tax=Muraenolepis orangiensis TaxID=630683 RepID=A0A9Q0E449_9TELE|nr:hypothetical protein NHX12_033544 [Muraenolepis orangiensis]